MTDIKRTPIANALIEACAAKPLRVQISVTQFETTPERQLKCIEAVCSSAEASFCEFYMDHGESDNEIVLLVHVTTNSLLVKFITELYQRIGDPETGTFNVAISISNYVKAIFDDQDR